jgi:hypothetical protein
VRHRSQLPPTNALVPDHFRAKIIVPGGVRSSGRLERIDRVTEMQLSPGMVAWGWKGMSFSVGCRARRKLQKEISTGLQ